MECCSAPLPTVRCRRGRLNAAVIYWAATSSPKHGVSVAQFYSEFSELLDELLTLHLQDSSSSAATYGANTAVDDRLLVVLESRSGITSNIRVVDPGLSDHFLLMSDINVRRPKPAVQRFSLRNFDRSVDPENFAANLKTIDVYVNPSGDVDSFTVRYSPQ